MTQSDVQQVMEKVMPGSDGECWKWTGAKSKEGYPFINMHGKHTSARRLLYEIYNKKEMPGNRLVVPTCENTGCVNPHHFDIYSRAKLARKHTLVGAEKPSSKLNADKVRKIRRQRDEGYATKDIAEEFGITPSTVSQICNRISWRHVD